ncbi:MAG: hypothetical protein PHN88_06355 [Ignavibacteria bacterium]|nr:hypothetical protein [Ignavibacteria bacterium]
MADRRRTLRRAKTFCHPPIKMAGRLLNTNFTNSYIPRERAEIIECADFKSKGWFIEFHKEEQEFFYNKNVRRNNLT